MTQLEIMDTIRREIREKGISQAEFSRMLGYGPQKFETDYYRVKHGHVICKSSLEMYLGFIGFKLSIERLEGGKLDSDCSNSVLKEQETIEPIDLGLSADFITWGCPICKRWLDNDYKYCPYCGKAVKWE